MTLETAELIVTIMGLYFAIGFLFALIFVIVGAPKIDPGAKGMPLRARAIILPGTMLLWPVMVVKFLTQKEPPIS